MTVRNYREPNLFIFVILDLSISVHSETLGCKSVWCVMCSLSE